MAAGSPENPFADDSPVESVGSDRVTRRGDALVVFAAMEMPDWRVAEHRKTVVLYGGGHYFVAEARRLREGRCRYVLRPWLPSVQEQPGRVIAYDGDYAAERDAAWQAGRADPFVAGLLTLAGPLVGFLPSRLKYRLNERYGVDPVSVTRQSLLLQFLLLPGLMLGGLFAFFLRPSLVDPIAAALGALFVDAAVRYNRSLDGGALQDGFGEWLVRFLGRLIRR